MSTTLVHGHFHSVAILITHISGVFDLFFPEKNSGRDLFSMAWILLLLNHAA